MGGRQRAREVECGCDRDGDQQHRGQPGDKPAPAAPPALRGSRSAGALRPERRSPPGTGRVDWPTRRAGRGTRQPGRGTGAGRRLGRCAGRWAEGGAGRSVRSRIVSVGSRAVGRSRQQVSGLRRGQPIALRRGRRREGDVARRQSPPGVHPWRRLHLPGGAVVVSHGAVKQTRPSRIIGRGAVRLDSGAGEGARQSQGLWRRQPSHDPIQGAGQGQGVRAVGGVHRTGRFQHRAEGPQVGGHLHRSVDAPHQGGEGGVGRERDRASGGLHQDQTQGVHIGPAVERLAANLFRRGVAGRAHHGAGGFCPGRLGQGPRQAEVGNRQAPLFVEDEVRRLDVAMDQAAPVGVVKGPGRVGADGCGLGR